MGYDVGYCTKHSVKESGIEPGTKSSKKEGFIWVWADDSEEYRLKWQEIQIWKFLGKRKEEWSGNSTGEWEGYSCTSRPSVRENSYHWGTFLETKPFRGSQGLVRARIVREEVKDMEDFVVADWIPESVWWKGFKCWNRNRWEKNEGCA